ncbi:hypothetical protein K0M31_008104 [Melipona bicolor]|uniref:Uncharacterized protein n=1 Tax=Melipona bicolor TaxID=60889 RepID=A0AA40FR07_9HYME|nr:hypothetical protein K0M31_008104 [Melipona bicolor]
MTSSGPSASSTHGSSVVADGIITFENAAAALRTALRTRELPMTRSFDEDIRVSNNKSLKGDEDKHSTTIKDKIKIGGETTNVTSRLLVGEFYSLVNEIVHHLLFVKQGFMTDADRRDMKRFVLARRSRTHICLRAPCAVTRDWTLRATFS